MTIKALRGAAPAIARDIRVVEEACAKHDGLRGGLFLDFGFNAHREMDTLFLLYDGERLVSLLALFVPTAHEAELSALTLPAYRRRGCFAALHERAAAECRKYGVTDLLFACETGSKDGIAAVGRYADRYDHTQYVLRLRKPFGMPQRFRLSLFPAVTDDIGAIAEMSRVIFVQSAQDAGGIVERTMAAPNRTQYVALLDGRYAGVVSTGIVGGSATIYGLGILPAYRGRGLGRELVALTVAELLRMGLEDIHIEVDSANVAACNLYLTSGFAVEGAVEYYRKRLD